MRRLWPKSIGIVVILSLVLPAAAWAASPSGPPPAGQETELHRQRRNLYEQMSALTGVPWFYLAAVDQYERSMATLNRNAKRNAQPEEEKLIAIRFTEQEWAGVFNPDKNDRDPGRIAFFGGIGLDGDGDGRADRNNELDVLYTAASRIKQAGRPGDDFAAALWQMYHNPRSVERIQQFAVIYRHFDRLNLSEHAFPLPLHADYSYRSTWGARRGWGGRRIHEGTDIFAAYGYPVRSTCYGIVEVKGWNRYGGWRVGIRSINNVYHYYAHLSGFEKSLKVGQVVAPGDTIGWVGSSGYGKPGTSGKFPPHLHYGLYRDGGLTDWAFDPYPYLVRWEREEKARKSRRG